MSAVPSNGSALDAGAEPDGASPTTVAYVFVSAAASVALVAIAAAGCGSVRGTARPLIEERPAARVAEKTTVDAARADQAATEARAAE